MRLQPRDYQVWGVQAFIKCLNEEPDENPLIAMPTGTGKSVVIAMILEWLMSQYPHMRIMVLTHVKELIKQNYDKLIDLWPQAPAGIYSSGLNRREHQHPCTFAGIASVAKRAQLFGHVNLVLVDEAHLVSPEGKAMYQQFFAELRKINPNVRIGGLTATPWRLGQGKITDEGGLFTKVCFDMTGMEAFNWLLEQGYLLPPVPRPATIMLNTDNVHMRGGEFIAHELQTAVNKEEITEKAVQEMIAMGEAENRHHWMVFAAGVEHSDAVCDAFLRHDIPAVSIHSKMGDKARDDAIRDYKLGKYKVAVNNNVLTTGFDFPGIDMIGMLRPTASTVLWVQMLGRGTRPAFVDGWDLNTQEGRLASISASGKQNCRVLDFAGNTRRLGPINDPVVPRKKGEGGGEAPVKECPGCGNYVHASLRLCCYCPHEFPIETKLKQAASTVELIKSKDVPVVDVFKIDHITYGKHCKAGVPDMMKVTYYTSNNKAFNEYVCFEHDNYAGKRARQWWRERSAQPFPDSTEDALVNAAHAVKAATHLSVWTNKKYPEIMGACFDGTAFGKEQSDGSAPTIETEAAAVDFKALMAKVAPKGELAELQDPALVKGGWDELEDDIPF
jgi:DNA repair protein RadD